MAEVSVLNKIAINPTAGIEAPTIPNKGSNVADWATLLYEVAGSIQCGDDFDLDATRVGITMDRKLAEIEPARSLTREDIILLKNKVDNITFSLYDQSEEAYTLLSDWAFTTNVGQPQCAVVNRTLIIEVNGLFLDYYPNVLLIEDSEGVGYGEDGAGLLNLIAFPMAFTGFLGGRARYQYQPAE